MSQNKQFKKVKLFRVLKVVFYSLGLPLFLVTVFLSAIKFIGHDPFMGETATTTAMGFFKQIEAHLTAPALHGFWIACALWAIISIIHIVLSKTVKSTRVRMLAVLASTLVVMFGSVLIMDTVFESKITDMQNNAQSGVVINDYKTQLSYYRTLSSNAIKKNDTLNLIEKVNLIKTVYNVEMEGADKGGTAGNIANKPVSYWNVVGDDGVHGVDISFKFNSTTGGYDLDVSGSGNNFVGDGNITKQIEGNQIIRLAPNGNGQLEINGKVYSHYWYKERQTKAGDKIYVWYTKDMMPVGTQYKNGTTVDKSAITDGVYGTGIYNANGMLSDGWVFSIYNMLEILEDYYEGKAIVEKYSNQVENLYEEAESMRDAYYQGLIPDQDGNYAEPWLQAIYNQEIEVAGRFSMTRRRLDSLVAKLGALLGNNSLFDFLLKTNEDGDSGLVDVADNFGFGEVLRPILEKLQKGMSFATDIIKNDATMTTVIDYVKPALGISGSVEIKDIYIVLAYAGATDVFGVKRDNLYLALVKDNGAGAIGTNPAKVSDGGDVLLDIDFSDKVIDDENSDYAFDLDHLSKFLNTAINGLLGKFGVNLKSLLVDNTIGSMLGGLLIKDIKIDGVTYKGLEIGGMQIPLFDEDYNAAIDISAILTNVLSSLYYYQSPVIKPVWEFYGWEESTNEEYIAASAALKQYQRAEYEAVAYGGMIGSVLIGDNLGTGSYPSALGLSDLTSVRQLKADLSYKPEFYPIYSLRDMILFFTGIVVLFYALSFVAQEKEIEYATGQLVVEERKARAKKVKKGAQTDEIATSENETTENVVDSQSEQATDAPIGDEALPAQENTDKGVL